MAEYIEKEKAIAALSYVLEYSPAKVSAIKAIRDIPSEEVEPIVHANLNNGNDITCPLCGASLDEVTKE